MIFLFFARALVLHREQAPSPIRRTRHSNIDECSVSRNRQRITRRGSCYIAFLLLRLTLVGFSSMIGIPPHLYPVYQNYGRSTRLKDVPLKRIITEKRQSLCYYYVHWKGFIITGEFQDCKLEHDVQNLKRSIKQKM